MKLTKKQRRYVTWGIFWVFSFVLFINNYTDLLTKYNISYNINTVSWIGIMGSLLYFMWKRMGGEI